MMWSWLRRLLARWRVWRTYRRLVKTRKRLYPEDVDD